MGGRRCERHQKSAIYACLSSSCEMEGFFCEICAKEGRHVSHSDEWVEVAAILRLPANWSNSGDIESRTLYETQYLEGSLSGNKNSLMYSTLEGLEGDRVISEPEELKEVLEVVEEKLMRRFRSAKSALMQKIIEFRHNNIFVSKTIIKEKKDVTKKESKKDRDTNNKSINIKPDSLKYLGIRISAVQNLLEGCTKQLEGLCLQQFDDYEAQSAKTAKRREVKGALNTSQDTHPDLPITQQYLQFSVAPFYKANSQIEFFKQETVIKAYDVDEAVISSKPLKFDKSYCLNFAISPNGDSPTFGVMLVEEECIAGEICFMHEGQISFVSDLNENTASAYLMKQKGMLVRPAHDIFWIDLNLGQHTFNVYDEQKNMFFQLDRENSHLNPQKKYFLAFHLYDITLQII